MKSEPSNFFWKPSAKKYQLQSAMESNQNINPSIKNSKIQIIKIVVFHPLKCFKMPAHAYYIPISV